MNEPSNISNLDAQTTTPPDQQATAWHRALLKYLQTQEPALWDWFSSHKARSESSDGVRLELLKSGYRLDREAAGGIYETAEAVAEKMHLKSTVTLYQAQQAAGLNASLAWLPNEAHVVLHGPVQETLTQTELAALMAHEFAHHELYTIDDGAYLVVEQILAAMVTDQAADASHDCTYRTHRLHTELYCDRRAAEVTGSIADCVCALVKMETGLKDVSAEAYLKQANEVLSDSEQKTKGSDGITHPEMFIRAKALQLWQDTPADADNALRRLVEGLPELRQMDFLRQQQMQELTSGFLSAFLADDWIQTDLMLGHAKRFFEDFQWPAAPSPDAYVSLKGQLAVCDEQLRNYFCFVLLDFATYDADLEEGPLAAAFLLAERVGLSNELRALAAKELKFGKRALQKVETDAEKIVRQMADSIEN